MTLAGSYKLNPLVVPDNLKQSAEYKLLHELTYAKDWTAEPKHDVAPIEAHPLGFIGA